MSAAAAQFSRRYSAVFWVNTVTSNRLLPGVGRRVRTEALRDARIFEVEYLHVISVKLLDRGHHLGAVQSAPVCSDSECAVHLEQAYAIPTDYVEGGLQGGFCIFCI